MTNSLKFKKKITLIQALRGVAALLVVLAHTDLIFNQNFHRDFLFSLFNFGGSGVDLFFVISGFIIFYNHHHDIGDKSKAKLFFIKRIIRIYPLYWIILSTKLISSFLFNYDVDTSQRNFVEIVKAFLLFPQDRNILSSSFLGVSWTLSFEILFYILFGLAIWFKPKVSFLIIMFWLCGIILNFLAITNISNNLILDFVFNLHNLQFFLGCLTAYIFLKGPINNEKKIILSALLLYGLSIVNFSYLLRYQELRVIVFGIVSALLIIGLVNLEFKNQINIHNAFIYLGNASYSIYLTHGFFINNITKFIYSAKPDIIENIMEINFLGLIIISISLVCGYFIYKYLEKPLIVITKLIVAKIE